MRATARRRGYTLREMFVVLVLLCIVFAVAAPLVHRAREEGRKTQCRGNLQQIALALQNYHDKHTMFPMGAMHAGIASGVEPPVNAALGPSWWFGILPFTGQNSYYLQVMQSQEPNGTGSREFCARDIQAFVVSASPPNNAVMRCPSTSLPATETPQGPIVLPSYVGIAGGCDIDAESTDYLIDAKPIATVPVSNRVYRNLAKGTGATRGGIVTSSGMLPPCEHRRMADCTDGTSNTIIVAEQSDWLRDTDRSVRRAYHGDPGWTVGGTGPGGGFLSGTRRVDPVPTLPTPGGPPLPWGADCWNITTVRYPPNLKRVLGARPLPGCSENHGINNPLQSPHPRGFQAAFVDGSVQFCTETTDLAVLLRVAIRDDGQTVVVD